MVTTSPSLLERLRHPNDSTAWRRFVELYAPLLLHWVRQSGVSAEDAPDVTQEVLVHLLHKLPAFQYDPQRSFGAWLRVVTQNKCRDHLRRKGLVPRQLGREEPEEPDVAEQFREQEFHSYVARRALELMRSEFRESTWQACWAHVVEGRSAADIAAQLGMSTNAVYIARSRVLRRLREELAGFIE